jgi:cation diffusion facilitator CzcD-associated flavoprotein CzcO
MKQKSVIVIGAGIGGITAAIHLARRGMHVIVLEKNDDLAGAVTELVVMDISSTPVLHYSSCLYCMKQNSAPWELRCMHILIYNE